MISDVEAYLAQGCGRCPRFDTPDCATRLWAPPLAALRDLCRAAGLGETAKWGHPCYTHAGRNVAILGATREGARLSFFDAGLLADPGGVLERQGPNTRHPDMVRATDAAQLADLAPAIRALLVQAMDHAAAGRREAPRTPDDIALPDALAAALDDDPALAEAFHRLTPGRRRSHAIHVGGARTPTVQAARVVRARGLILAGKGAHDRD
jgi:uncharacterized protein YdeI (YjbR/CyaY-like superfamily)